MSKARETRSQISSIQSTRKITAAMELVAASKVKKVQGRMYDSLPYAEKIRQVIEHVRASSPEYKHPYLATSPAVQRVAFLVVSSDRGLCGGLNANLFRQVLLSLQAWEKSGVSAEIFSVGHKGGVFFERLGISMGAAIEHLGEAPSASTLIGVTQALLDRYSSGAVQRVYLAHNVFVNTVVQRPTITPLLPLTLEASDVQQKPGLQGHWDYIYEPDDARSLLTRLLVRYIESQVYQAVVENIACEQAARMVAMKNATDNASDLIKELQLIYNKVRQAGITQEIAEIVGGAEAIE
eukprot:TRINITY_DN6721_c1_g2_i2.p3 TRINITY_DN6721_c1_g2~~TRINITY_DN6721_c1_g2_i2.p3  ORF type:complete len:295 (+),score=-49.29 TRINITY_DN6721_c1_g2_i2:4478-5362(+)